MGLSIKISTKLPGGDKSSLNNSHIKLEKILNNYELIYPGHGSIFKNHNFIKKTNRFLEYREFINDFLSQICIKIEGVISKIHF